MLLFGKRYDCLKRILFFTKCHPLKNYVLPDNLDDIFDCFFFFSDLTKIRDPKLSNYRFPGLDGVLFNDIVQEHVCKYIALLFLWLYKADKSEIQISKINFNPVEKSLWLTKLDDFKKYIDKLLAEEKLIDVLELESVADELSDQSESNVLEQFFESLKAKLEKPSNNEP